MSQTLSNHIHSAPQQLSQQQLKSIEKAQRMILQFNKNGLQYLTNDKTHSQAFEYFKKAQRTILDELKISPFNKKVNQLAAITYNNLACYYKKTAKPKVALSYLKKALQIEVFKVQNWLSTASTHLNICAIYSFMKKHEQACEHASLAIKMLQKWQNQQMPKKQPEQQLKTYQNVKMLANYNAAIQNQHLKKFQQSTSFYESTRSIASKNQQKNSVIIKACEQGIQRVKQQQKLSKQKLLQILTKRKQHDIKNNHEWMRKNKKNFPKDNEGWRELIKNRKYAQYKIEPENRNSQSHQASKKHQSVGKLASIKPVLHTEHNQKNSTHLNSGTLTKRGPEGLLNVLENYHM